MPRPSRRGSEGVQLAPSWVVGGICVQAVAGEALLLEGGGVAVGIDSGRADEVLEEVRICQRPQAADHA